MIIAMFKLFWLLLTDKNEYTAMLLEFGEQEDK